MANNKISNKVYTHNHNVPNQFAKIAQWHEDRNLIAGATDDSQFEKLLEEVVELYMTIHRNDCNMSPLFAKYDLQEMIGKLHSKGRIKQAPEGKTIEDDVGDINVVLINLLERNGFTMQQCLDVAWNDIKDRKGKMIDGVFVKEADL